jgi:hypothetical protein
MKACLFCSNKAGSKEHIIADWLIKKMMAEDLPITIAHRNEKGIEALRTHKLGTYKVSCVCGDCNNGWMSQLENWFKRDMGMLVEPDWPRLGTEFLRVASREKKKLARWAIKTAAMISYNSKLGGIQDFDLLRTVKDDGELPDIIVEVGHIAEPIVGANTAHGFWVRNGANEALWQTFRDFPVFNCLMQFNHLALRVFRCPQADPIYTTATGRLPLRMFPNPDAKGFDGVDYRFHSLREMDEKFELQIRPPVVSENP